MSEELSYYITPAPVDDAGPIRHPPELIGLCSEHGWWFPAQATHQGWCPESGCHATVYIYERFAEFQPVATAQ